MRTLLWSSLLFCSLLRGLPASFGEDLCEGLSDGGFEEGRPSSSWSETTSGLQIISQSSLLARSGSWFAGFGGQLFAPLSQSLEQTLTVPTGRVELSYYLRIPEASTDETDFLRVSVDGTELAYYSAADASFFDIYQRVAHNLGGFADGASHTLRFESSVSGRPVTTFRLDDVSLDLCPALTRKDLFLFANRWYGTAYGVEDLWSDIADLR